jgi:hypothetical protein
MLMAFACAHANSVVQVRHVARACGYTGNRVTCLLLLPLPLPHHRPSHHTDHSLHKQLYLRPVGRQTGDYRQ